MFNATRIATSAAVATGAFVLTSNLIGLDAVNTLSIPLSQSLRGKTLFARQNEIYPTHKLGDRPIALYFNMSVCPDCKGEP